MQGESVNELKSLYPDLTPEELIVARENLDRYLALAWEIFEEAHAGDVVSPAFPQPESRGRIKERSIPTQT
jgi:hypothetical protein